MEQDDCHCSAEQYASLSQESQSSAIVCQSLSTPSLYSSPRHCHFYIQFHSVSPICFTSANKLTSGRPSLSNLLHGKCLSYSFHLIWTTTLAIQTVLIITFFQCHRFI
ncbi:hypothetical protein J6590_084188 [Homalodisca vitripennis]|nr:hypothetical protein J6590_084188 [Homalodisca vitripennis]